jgi:hypothetical protein
MQRNFGVQNACLCDVARVSSMRFQAPHPSVSNKLKSTKLLVLVTFSLYKGKKETPEPRTIATSN